MTLTGYIERIPISSTGSTMAYCFVHSNGKEYFLHRSDLDGEWNDLVDDVNALKKRVRVKFTPLESERGPRASKCTVEK